MSPIETGMIGNVNAEVVAMPTEADLQFAAESQKIRHITSKDIARAAMVFGVPFLTLACNSVTWGLNDGRVGLGLCIASFPILLGIGFGIGAAERTIKKIIAP